jgi:cell division protein FtsI (penicillin-binding protein 3)
MTRKPRTAENFVFRHALVWLMLVAAFGSLIWRLSILHIQDSKFLQGEGVARSVRAELVHAPRGMILDRNGEPLAVSSPVKSIWVNPKVFKASPKSHWRLAKILNIPSALLRKKLKQNSNKNFLYLKRHVSPAVGKKIAGLDINGLYQQTEYRRYYPQSEVSAHVVGSTNVDQKGIQGLELVYNKWLTGIHGKKTLLKDRTGKRVEMVQRQVLARAGEHLTLSIDSRLQYYAFKELLKTIKKHKAKSGTLVALDVQTGEILSMVNYPSFNPNQRFKVVDSRFRNRAVTDQFEPGSTIKPFSMVNLINSGKYDPHTFVDTSPGWVKVGSNKITDVRNFGLIDLNTVIKKSSNVGISKLTLSLPGYSLSETLQNFGFGKITSSGFPGERSGILTSGFNLKPIELAALSYGYGLTVTPLQLAQAYATLASNGKKREVTFLKKNTKASYRQVLRPTVAKVVNKMLQLAIGPGGTGTKANVPGYNAAGKTGTVRKVNKSGYTENSHLSLFAGFAPVESPKVAIVVVIDEPTTGVYYGGQVAAPLFSRVMYNALRYKNIPTIQMKPNVILAKR